MRRPLAVLLPTTVVVGILAIGILSTIPAASQVPVIATAIPASAFTPLLPEDSSTSIMRAAPALLTPSSPSPSSGVVFPKVPATVRSIPRENAVAGTASWFRSPIGVSAAGPALRVALGPGWRGSVVTVEGPTGVPVLVTLGDFCRCDTSAAPLIDLDAAAFIAVCGPLSRGLCRVEVSW